MIGWLSQPPAPGAVQPTGGQAQQPAPAKPPFRYPIWGAFAGDGMFPLDWLPKNYSFVVPYVVGASIEIPANGSFRYSYPNPNDSDFIILKTRSISKIRVDSGLGTVYYLNNPGIYVSVRIPSMREITTEAVAFDILFPDRYFLPFYWATPIFLSRGDTLEITFSNRTASSWSGDITIEGIRGYD